MRGLWFVVALGIVSVSPFAHAEPADNPIVKRLLLDTAALRWNGTSLSMRLPVEVAAGVAKASAQVIGVSVGGVADPGLPGTLDAQIEVGSDGGPSFLLLSAKDRKSLSRPGTYDVVISLRSEVDGKSVAASTVVHAVVEKASLRAVPALRFERQLGLLKDEPLVPSALTVRESSGRGDLAPFAVEQLGSATHEDQPITFKLLARTPAPVSADSNGEVTFSTEGQLPPGTTKGKLELRAPQMGDPVVVDYEIRARYSTAWILPIFLVAGFLGWFLRVFLRQRESRFALEVQAAGLWRQAQAEVKRDPENCAELNQQCSVLKTALGQHEPEKIQNAVKELDPALAKAVAERVRRQNELLAPVTAKLTTLAASWQMPTEVEIATAVGLLQDAKTALVVGDLDRGRKAIESADRKLTDLRLAAQTWAAGAGLALNRLLTGPCPADLRAQRKDDLAALVDAIKQLEALPQGAPMEEWLRLTSAAQSLAAQVAARFRVGSKALRDAASAAFPDPAAQQRVQDSGQLPADADPPIASLATLAGFFQKLDDTVRAEITHLYGQNAQSPAVVSLLSSGNYVQAVRTAAAPPPAAPRAPGVPPATEGAAIPGLNGTPISDGKKASPGLKEETVKPIPVTVGPNAGVTLAAPAYQSVEHLLSEATQKLHWTRWAIGIGTAGVSAVAAWVLYRNAWVGSVKDVMGLATVAFMSDFTLDALMETLRKTKT